MCPAMLDDLKFIRRRRIPYISYLISPISYLSQPPNLSATASLCAAVTSQSKRISTILSA